jgi:hypothetical protein
MHAAVAFASGDLKTSKTVFAAWLTAALRLAVAFAQQRHDAITDGWRSTRLLACPGVCYSPLPGGHRYLALVSMMCLTFWAGGFLLAKVVLVFYNVF